MLKAHIKLKVDDGRGIHSRPATELSLAIRDLDARICFYNQDAKVEIDTYTPAIDILMAAAILTLIDGAEFYLECEGPDGDLAFDRLNKVFSNGYYYSGSIFTEIP